MRASLHNADQMAKLDLHNGDMVYVEKGGEIIPKIVDVDVNARAGTIDMFGQIQFPANCPECGSSLSRGGRRSSSLLRKHGELSATSFR